jgi:uncharacterized RDD family membrane protein YckC
MAEAAAPEAGTEPAATPSLLRRLASMLYDALLLLGVVFVATFLFLLSTQGLDETWRRALLQVFVLCICGVYFVWLWRHGGQTLPMKTWRLRLVAAAGGPISLRAALTRHLLAWLLLAAGGVGILWAFVDRDRQFLWDRLACTRLVNT